MIHPSPLAVQHIFQQFQQKYFSSSTIAFVQRIEQVRKDIGHSPRFPDSPTYAQHLRSCWRKVDELENEMQQVYGFSKEQAIQIWKDERELLNKQLKVD